MKYLIYPKGDRTRIIEYRGKKYPYVWIGDKNGCFGYIEIKRIKKMCKKILKDLEQAT